MSIRSVSATRCMRLWLQLRADGIENFYIGIVRVALGERDKLISLKYPPRALP